MNPRPSSGTHALASGLTSEQVEHIVEIVKEAMEQQRPRFSGWHFLVAWAFSLIVPIVGFVWSQNLEFKGVTDEIANHEVRLKAVEEDKMSRDVIMEHWKSQDEQLSRIEAEIIRSRK